MSKETHEEARPGGTMDDLPTHIEETVQDLAALHRRHDRETLPVERRLARLTRWIASPFFIATLSVLFVAWIAMNVAMQTWGGKPFDPPPFSWLAEAATLLSVYVTLLILVTQSRENVLAQHRDQLTLQLAILSERKSAKIIELLEDLRRDSPHIVDRVDAEAEEMSRPADTASVGAAIKSAHEGMLNSRDP
jgi:uncharacterized membrane protein